MEMKACDDIDDIGVDLTPKILPLVFSLSDSFLHSHCSSCFLPLPPLNTNPFLPNNNSPPTPTTTTTTILSYCSSTCSLSDSHIHISSGESQLFSILQSQPTSWTGDTSDLRAALRLLLFFQHDHLPLLHYYDRIHGLMTNHKNLVLLENEDEEEVLARIKEGGRLISLARRIRDGGITDEMKKNSNLVEEMVLCLVLTNAVEVQINGQGSLGIAVYGPNFSWINHSCSPNACYLFSLSGSDQTMDFDESKLRIFPSGHENVLKTRVCDETKTNNGICYGPRIVVRSIKKIKKGEEVCITYTDLLQPKGIRHSELWSKYRFICCCQRCIASPPSYVDRVLQQIAASCLEKPNTYSGDNSYGNIGHEELIDYVDDIIAEYLSVGNPESCCEKLENLLTQSVRENQPEEEKMLSRPKNFNLHPLHHLSLNAFITLSSAYKVRANNLWALNSGLDDQISEVLELSKTSTAYYLLLAGVTHHFSLYESSLIAVAAHFWVSAGESLLDLVRSPIWSPNLSLQLKNGILTSQHDLRENKCKFIEKLETVLLTDQSETRIKQLEFEEISKAFLGCVLGISLTVWPFLIHGHRYLKYIEDPINFSWLGAPKNPNFEASVDLASRKDDDFSYYGRISSCCCRFEASEASEEQRRTSVLQLGVDCLLYGGYLARICYGKDGSEKLLDVSEIMQKYFLNFNGTE